MKAARDQGTGGVLEGSRRWFLEEGWRKVGSKSSLPAGCKLESCCQELKRAAGSEELAHCHLQESESWTQGDSERSRDAPSREALGLTLGRARLHFS